MTLTDTINTVQVETNSSFSQITPNLQLAWDSTSLGALKSCPRLYKYTIIDGYTGTHMNDHLTFGIIFHSATELYARQRAKDIDHEEALLSAIRHVILETWDYNLNRPWTSEEPTKTRKTLLRTVIWYLDNFKDANLETLILPSGRPAVEVPFRFETELESESGEQFLLCGYIDRIVSWNGEIWITDKKTTKYALDENYFRQYTPDNQISIYSLAGMVTQSQEVNGLIIDGCQVLVNSSKFRRQPIPRSKDQLEEWLTDLKFWLHMAETFARSNHWPMNEKSCGYGNRQCQFRPICSTEPAMRHDLLEALFIKRIWDPLQPR